jgi:hypothetical protein
MGSPSRYPSYLQFPSAAQQRLAEQLLPHTRAFFVGGILDESEDTGWTNVLFHCLTEAMAIGVLADTLPELGTRETLQQAALVHDAYKRREVEEMRKKPKEIDILYTTDNDSKDWLRVLGYPEEVIELQEAFGNNAARRIFQGEITDLTRRTLHYIDDITQDDRIVSLETRLSALEQNPRYAEQNEWSRRIFGGLSLYEAKRQINGETERELSAKLGVEPAETLPQWIQAHFSEGRQ